MPIEDPKSLLTQGENALYAGKYDEARRLFRHVMEIASSRSKTYEDAENHMRHLDESDDAKSFRLVHRPDELSIQGQDALEAGDFDEARRLFRHVMEIAPPDSGEYGRAAQYVRHLGDNDEAEPFRLLMQIRQEKDARKRADLLAQAQVQGLEFTLPGEQRLDKLLEQAQAEIRAQQEREAQKLLHRGDEARRQGALERALDLYQQALATSDVGSALRESIAGRITECNKKIDEETKLTDLLSRAEGALNESHYGDAQAILEEAAKLRPGDPRMEELVRRAREGVNAEAFVKDQLTRAQNQEESAPWWALELYNEALAQAQETGLESLAKQAEEGGKRTEKLVEQRLSQADELVNQAK